MTDDFLIARNTEEESTLPYLVRIPLGRNGIVLKVKEMWPRTSKVYCHPASGWPDDAEVLERLPGGARRSSGRARARRRWRAPA